MIRTFYNALWYAAAPLLRLYLRRRARLSPAYAEHWAERFGEPYPQPVQNALWIHAVSVGETRAAQPLIAALQARFPDAPLLLTQSTPTGRATAQALYPQAQCRYLPYDRADWVRRFVAEHRPRCGVLMETEIWPNLIHTCTAADVPLFLANGRLSERSQRGYTRIGALVRPALRGLRGCFAQTEADARRLREIGAENVQVLGNTKYDIVPPAAAQDLAAQFRALIGQRQVWVAGSTRQHGDADETHMILQAWQQHGSPQALLIIVPRHPERFDTAVQTAQDLGLRVQRRSSGEAVRADTQVWVGDSMGEMFAYYQVADVVFVGGSLVDTGCQNIIEPMSCGKAVLFGTSTYNFQAVCADALAAGAAAQIASADELVRTVNAWLAHPEQCADKREKARDFVAQHQGASERIATAIVESL
ncbi:lipid IV(A) 3-deoxy-D-manno-octulosonic acid transferase [Conchiformibius steedae]|uniref:lipid IV(A) 3-deoxy-D-manno-octulosonic acid transferase n=1 Tax=Conchiformibius steedae TaxID=153493 RepID=UPI0026EEA90E|nr:lipid IV(A) 3-deoxy-D-manno-octulosonic acid transferase [Conchiformibius steedae]